MSHVDYICNVCGFGVKACPFESIDREVPSCSKCKSTVRARSVIHLLSLGLFRTSMPLPTWPFRRDLHGIGLSDWHGFNPGLKAKLSYTNTFFHQEPFFDITHPPLVQKSKYDFLISSDVFEHTAPPSSQAFAGARSVLKNNGLLVLTVPFTNAQETVEHFPHLNTFKIVEIANEHLLINKRSDGQFEMHRNLVFHGGSDFLKSGLT